MKYIMVRFQVTGTTRRTLPVVFAEIFTHKEMAEVIVRNREIRDREPEVVSAGFVHHGKVPMVGALVDGLICGGKSESLGLAARPEDTQIMNMHQYGIGVE